MVVGRNSIQLSVLLSVNFEVEVIYHHIYSKYSIILYKLTDSSAVCYVKERDILLIDMYKREDNIRTETASTMQ